ncbi:hypothetical protein [Thalassobius sp. I31.1]|uniref:hypothetical protein n=1 Tax=Thalassobius sp. I31.1 TaxID=2109912 RepID=UPI00130056B7|nr:hypothetical protein [Thalassobius sp. I31.1]
MEFISYLFKTLWWTFLTFLGLSVLFFLFWILSYNVTGPLFSKYYTWRAERVNDEIWVTENAQIYEISVRYEINGVPGSVFTEMICANKARKRNSSLKNSAEYRRPVALNVGRRISDLTLAPGYDLKIGLPGECPDIAGQLAEGRFPVLPGNERARIRSGASGLHCYYEYSARPAARLDSIVVFRPEITAVRETPLREIMTRTEFGTSDMHELWRRGEYAGENPRMNEVYREQRAPDCVGM